jgi:hypothetical protein
MATVSCGAVEGVERSKMALNWNQETPGISEALLFGELAVRVYAPFVDW